MERVPSKQSQKTLIKNIDRSRLDYLHGYCFHEGRCEPVKEVKRRILETRQYIDDVKNLIGS